MRDFNISKENMLNIYIMSFLIDDEKDKDGCNRAQVVSRRAMDPTTKHSSVRRWEMNR